VATAIVNHHVCSAPTVEPIKPYASVCEIVTSRPCKLI
jgi:hypothetical protein